MRVISQNGEDDCPYEKCCIWLDGRGPIVKCSPVDELGRFYVLAIYSTREKAIKAMELLRMRYIHSKTCETYKLGQLSYNPTFQFPEDEDVEV